MHALEKVRTARTKLKQMNKTEHESRELIEDLIVQTQDIIVRMNVAKLAALREAEKPFLEELEKLDAEMAVFITLAA